MTISFSVTVGGQAITPMQFDVTGTSFGSVGSAQIVSGIAALGGLDLFNLASTSNGIAEVLISATVDGQTTRIFGGEHLSTAWDYDYDTVTIHARSWAGVLVDQKRVLSKIGAATTAAFKALVPGQVSASGISNQNQRVGNIVASIANEFGFKPVLNLGNGNPVVGTLYGAGDQTFMPVPQSLWSILNQLARDTGYVVYDTPDKELVFGEPGAGLPTIALAYKTPSKDQQPVRRFRIEHQPRRNSTFRVLVVSYEPHHAAVVLGRANYVGRDMAGSSGLPAGLSTGTRAIKNDATLAKLGAKSTQVPLYTFHFDGLTADQANTMAAAVATDIAKRELILACRIDGYPTILPAQKVKMGGEVPGPVQDSIFYVSGYTHTFRMPRPHQHGEEDGFVTLIKGLNIPTDALAAETAG